MGDAAPDSSADPDDGVAARHSRPGLEDAAAQRRWDLGVFLPALGAFLFVSPMVRLFAEPVSFGGAPGIVLYIFGLWLALILAAALLARMARRAHDGQEPPA